MEDSAQGSRWTSKLLFLGMVAAAGVVAWYGMGAGSPVPATPEAGQPTTLAMLPGSALPTVAPAESGVPRTGLPTRLVLGAADIDAPVEGVGVVVRGGEPVWDTAWSGVGHHIDSAFPGQPGNVVITGHVSVANRTHVPYFAGLDRVKAGDIVEIYSGALLYRYRVDEVTEVEPDDVRVLRSDHRSRVTLITCTRDLKHRLVVTGTLVTA